MIRTLKGIQERIRHIVLTQASGISTSKSSSPCTGRRPGPTRHWPWPWSTPDRWAAGRQSALVVLLDEFQELERLGGTPLIKKLRSIFQAQERCTYLLLGSQESTLKTLFSDRRQAFYRFASIKALPPVPGEAWLEYLRGKYESVGIKTSTVALEIMIRETGGHPFGMMQLANAVYLRCLPRQKPAVSQSWSWPRWKKTSSPGSPLSTKRSGKMSER